MRIAGKATKGKGKRWTKGSSSSSNPESRKHRLQAKSIPSAATVSRPESQQSLRLTTDTLNQHNLNQMKSLTISRNSMADISDLESVGAQSFASVWTNCSNVSFNKLLMRFDSSSAVHKQMLSVLAAITEAIHSNGGKETETEYFAALMTTLESVDSEETLTATLSLIEMVIRRLPPNVIRLKFSETSKIFVEYLAKYLKGDNGVIIRSLTNSIATLLLQQESAVWELSSTKNIFEILLSLTVHNKPRIRKCAEKSIARILRSNSQSVGTICHPMAKLTADFCIRKIEENGVNDNINANLYILLLLTDILSVLPNSSLKKCCESILTHMTFGNVLIVSAAFKAFFILFSSQPNELILTPELNAKLISALYDYQPNINDSQPLCAWFQTIQRAFANLNRIDRKLCSNHLPKLFNISVACLLSDSKEVHLSIVNNLKQIYTDCVGSSSLNIDKNIIEKIYSSVEKVLQFEYCNAWPNVFGLISHMFDNNYSQFITNIINKLFVIRESYDCIYAPDIDHSIGAAIQTFGPKYILELCPLALNDENCDVSHNWLIPVLRDNVRNTELSQFIDYFVPLITTLEKTCASLESEGKQVTAKTCSILVSQLWSLLPSFCKQPTDFERSFKRIAQLLGHILSNKPLLRGYVLTSFRNISKSFDNQLVRKELSKFSKNFIPILFNIYTTEQNLNEEKDQRFSVFEVIQIFLSVSENSLLMSLYTKLMEKFRNSSNNNSFMNQSLMDLIRAFVSYVTKDEIKDIYSHLVLPFIRNNQLITEQKKAFRVLEEICRNESIVCHNFFTESLVDITNVLIQSISDCLSSSKSYVLKALKEIIERNLMNESIDWKKLFIEITPKILNCFLINSKKVKTAAFDLLISIANAYKSLNGLSLDQFFELIISYLHKSDYPSSAVIMTLTHLYTEFRNQIPKHIECDLIENIISSLGSDKRQTIQSSIDFLKYFFKIASADQLSTYLELLINKLSNINRKHKNHFRIKIKEIFVRLVRKYGYPMISKMIPEEYKKVLKNIRKYEDRKKKKSEADNQSDDERQTVASKIKRKNEFEDIIADSSDEESDDDEQMTDLSKQNKSWIKEQTDENEIIDLLSTKVSKNILHKNPESNSKKKEVTFEMSSDGKLVIQDLDNPEKGIKRGLEEDNDSDDNQKDNDLSDDDMTSKRSVKTNKSKESGYKAGGKGIHRPIKEPGMEYRSDKAKGDMKRKGKPDPYAYIPLNRQFLNKRKKAKMSGRFNNLIKAAKKGAQTGSAIDSKKRRKH